MSNNLKSYYQNGVKLIKKNTTEWHYDYNGAYVGYVESYNDWGKFYKAIPLRGEKKYGFKTLRAANDYLVSLIVQ